MFAKPSYLGFWIAPTPWGPFTQIHEEVTWTPGNDNAARAFLPQIAPKWISPDGKSFWLIWSDYQVKGPNGETENADLVYQTELARNPPPANVNLGQLFLNNTRRFQRHYGVNAQRIDLALS